MKTKRIMFCLINFIYLSGLYINGQDMVKKNYFSSNLYYPIPVGNNFIADNYQGVLSAEIEYNLNLKGNWFAGLNFEYERLYLNKTNVNLEVLKPSLCLIYHTNSGKFEFIPQMNIGYSIWRFFSEELTGLDVIPAPSAYASQQGLSLMPSIALAYHVSNKISVKVILRYEYSWLNKPHNTAYASYNQHIQLLFPGIGININM